MSDFYHPNDVVRCETRTDATSQSPAPALQISRPASDWAQIDMLAAQIEMPSIAYDSDALKMAQAVIEDNRRRAALIRKIVPYRAHNCF